jgi:hypothetical protein
MSIGTETTKERPVDKLLKDMKRTKGVRFNAAKRLEESDRKRTANTAYASAAVIVLTLLPVFFPMPVWASNSIALATVGFSIFILASSLIQASHAGQVKADQFQRCALEINSLRRDLISYSDDASLDLQSYTGRYDEILRRYNINHDDVDYDKYRLEHPDEFPALAAEETATARKAVDATDKWQDTFGKVIVVVTAAAFAAALPLTETVLQRLMEILGLAGAP